MFPSSVFSLKEEYTFESLLENLEFQALSSLKMTVFWFVAACILREIF
jgi:hypothetical protein